MKTLLLSFATGLMALSTLAQNPAATIRQLETRRFEALQTRDARFLNDVLADDLIYTHSSGNQDTKRSFIESITSGRQVYQNLQISRDTVRLYSPDLAIATGHLKGNAVVNGQAVPLTLRYTDVYARRRGRWQMIAWQSARVAE